MSELENTKDILDYLNTVKDTENYKNYPPSLNDWIESEKERLNKEYFNLSILNADDKEIISQALLEMSNKYRESNQFTVANKIAEVRKRFLDDETEKYAKTNLNLYIKVKLNDYGKQIHYDDWKDICKETGTPYELKVDEEGYSEFQLYEFMNTFGKHATLAGKPFLETTDVLIERSKK